MQQHFLEGSVMINPASDNTVTPTRAGAKQATQIANVIELHYKDRKHGWTFGHTINDWSRFSMSSSWWACGVFCSLYIAVSQWMTAVSREFFHWDASSEPSSSFTLTESASFHLKQTQHLITEHQIKALCTLFYICNKMRNLHYFFTFPSNYGSAISPMIALKQIL